MELVPTRVVSWARFNGKLGIGDDAGSRRNEPLENSDPMRRFPLNSINLVTNTHRWNCAILPAQTRVVKLRSRGDGT